MPNLLVNALFTRFFSVNGGKLYKVMVSWLHLQPHDSRGWRYISPGHFLPEEDDKFLEKVRAAVEEEERQALAAADTDAARDAIATAEVSRKTIPSYNPESKDPNSNAERLEERNDQRTASADDKVSNISTDKEPGKQFGEGQGCGRVYDYAANLPMEFYHYYYGSNTDMGTLIEVIEVIFLSFSLIAESCGKNFIICMR